MSTVLVRMSGRMYSGSPSVEAEDNDRLEAARLDQLHNLVDVFRWAGLILAPAPPAAPASSPTPAPPSAPFMPISVCAYSQSTHICVCTAKQSCNPKACCLRGRQHSSGNKCKAKEQGCQYSGYHDSSQEAYA